MGWELTFSPHALQTDQQAEARAFLSEEMIAGEQGGERGPILTHTWGPSHCLSPSTDRSSLQSSKLPSTCLMRTVVGTSAPRSWAR